MLEVCRGAQSGSQILSSERFDAVIVDCDDLQDGLAVVETMRKSSSNKKAVAFSILNGTSTQKAFHLGAKFVLQKPVSQVNAKRCLTAAINFMATERRRCFRHPVELPATLSFSKGNDLKATMTNLSDAGRSLSACTSKTGMGCRRSRKNHRHKVLTGLRRCIEPRQELVRRACRSNSGRIIEVQSCSHFICESTVLAAS